MRTDYLALDFKDNMDAVARSDSRRRVSQDAWAAASSSLSRSGIGRWTQAAEPPARGARVALRLQCVPADRRGWPRDLLHRQDRDGPGADHLPAADAGRRTGDAAGVGGHRHGRHRAAARGTWGRSGRRRRGISARPLQAAAAEARAVLLELAAEALKVPQAQLAAKDGAIFDRQNKERASLTASWPRGRRSSGM